MMFTTEQILDIAVKKAGLDCVPADSGVLVPGENIKKAAFGVDIEVGEVLLAKELGVDCLITHHPEGEHLVNLFKVMENQIDRMVEAGVPINKAQKVLSERKEQVERNLHVSNYNRAVSAARLLGMSFVAIHSPADFLAQRVVQKHLDEKIGPYPKATLKDVVNALMELPEYQKTHAQPKIRVGSEESYAGKVFVTFAGGTSGGAKVFKAYFEAGIGTLVVMHVPDDVVKEVKEQNIGNVIVAGHMASDSVGINQIIEELEKAGLEVVRFSGVIDPK
ncbi:MAG: hypothetical protein ACOY3J_07010 [Bacillota bacterium]|nr:hypothetical protein [Thermanaerosceptrum fracticalcis]